MPNRATKQMSAYLYGRSDLTQPLHPNFSLTKVNIAVAMLTTMNVAIARQTASDSVNFQMASMQRTVQATSDTVITANAIQRTIAGFTTPRDSLLIFTTTSVSSRCMVEV